MRIQLLHTASLAILILAVNLLIRFDKPDSVIFWIALCLILVSLWGWYKAIEYAKLYDNDRDTLMKTLIAEIKGFRDDVKNRK